MNPNDFERQRALCQRYNTAYAPVTAGLKVGISRNVQQGVNPINGLRHMPVGDTSGWYIWAGGEPSDAPDFFVPLHVEHLAEWCPEIVRFLALPPGWRFLAAEGHEDAWEDPSLLHV